MALAQPLINGFLPAYADVQMRVNGLLFVGVASIDYSDNLSRGQPYGTAAISLGLTKGSYKAKGTVELYLPAAITFEQSLYAVALPLGGLRFIPIQFSIGYAPAGIAPLPVVTDSFTAYLGDISQTERVSDDAIVRKYELLIPGVISWNGVAAITETGTFAAVA
jgi:hypothetical protein